MALPDLRGLTFFDLNLSTLLCTPHIWWCLLNSQAEIHTLSFNTNDAFRNVSSHHPGRFDTKPCANVSSLDSIIKFIVLMKRWAFTTESVKGWSCYYCKYLRMTGTISRVFTNIIYIIYICFKLFPAWKDRISDFSLMKPPHNRRILLYFSKVSEKSSGPITF